MASEISPETNEVLQSLVERVEEKLQSMIQVRKRQVLERKSRALQKHRKEIMKLNEDVEKEKARRDKLIIALRRKYAACPGKSERELEERLRENDELLEKLKKIGPPKF